MTWRHPSGQGYGNVATLDKVDLDIQVVLGTTTMHVHQVLRLGRAPAVPAQQKLVASCQCLCHLLCGCHQRLMRAIARLSQHLSRIQHPLDHIGIQLVSAHHFVVSGLHMNSRIYFKNGFPTLFIGEIAN